MVSGFDIKVEGLDRMNSLVQKIQKYVPDAVAKTLFYGAQLTMNEAKRSIQASGSKGVTYKRGNILHTASTAGNPPNTDTGNLVNNITVEKIDGGYDVGSRKDAPYGLALELGTSNMLPRKWLTPAYEKAIKATIDKAQQVMDDYFRKVTR